MSEERAKKFGSTVESYVIIRDGKTIDPATGKEREPLQHRVPLPVAKRKKKDQVRS